MFSSLKVDPSKKLATWALAFGIINLFTFGLLGLGTLAGLTLGIIALIKTINDSERYSGKKLAVTGLVLTSISLFTSVFAFAGIIGFIGYKEQMRKYNEHQAMIRIAQIYQAQEAYLKTVGKGNYTTKLSDLNNYDLAESINEDLAAGQKQPLYGYIYGDMKIGLASEGIEPRFSITCRPANTGWLTSTGNDCYYIDQSGIMTHSGAATVIPDANSATLN